jgi:hypothetical protein
MSSSGATCSFEALLRGSKVAIPLWLSWLQGMQLNSTYLGVIHDVKLAMQAMPHTR